MPQLDVFIFLNSGIYLFIGFFMLLAYIHVMILPRIGSVIKLRKKIKKNQSNLEKIALPKIDLISIEKLI